MSSNARSLALLSYVVILCAGCLVLLWLMAVERAPLPREEIAALRGPAWPRAEIILSAAPGAVDSGQELGEFARLLAAALEDEAVTVRTAEAPPPRLLGLASCTAAGEHGSTEACLASLQEIADSAQDERAPHLWGFELMLAPSGDRSALLLGTGLEAILRWRRQSPLGSLEELALSLAERLRETWLQRLSFASSATLFEIAPSYMFSFFLVGDCGDRIGWDFPRGVLLPFLQRFFDRLRLLFDFEVDSQVIQCGSLGQTGSGSRSSLVIKVDTVQDDFLRQAGGWPGDALVRDARWLPPLIRFVAFRPTEVFGVVDGEGRLQNSFSVQGWGTVAIDGANVTHNGVPCRAARRAAGEEVRSTAELFSKCEAASVASAWVSNLRSWLALPPDAPVPEASRHSGGTLSVEAALPRRAGVTDWELRKVAIAVHALFVRRTIETLVSFVELVDSLPDVAVTAEVSQMAFEAASAARRAVEASEAHNLEEALSSSRQGLALALTASHDDTVVAQMYFSWEFKYAVYLPLFLPVVMPILVGSFRHVKKEKAVRKVRHQKAAEAALAAKAGPVTEVS
mmetsp:Transcript_20404/g.44472  ORF Transcript_20404/g.44472 Transcript_20404/m.44472 type:complete len:570 (-) Transcript_20404:45-1754(-)